MGWNQEQVDMLEARIERLEELIIDDLRRSKVVKLPTPATAQPIKLGMICETSAPCGIGEHTQYLARELHLVDVENVWIKHDPAANSYTDVVHQIVAHALDVVHIHHEWSLWTNTNALLELLKNCYELGVATVLDMHTVTKDESPQSKSLRWNSATTVWHNVLMEPTSSPRKDEEVFSVTEDSSLFEETDPFVIPLALPRIGPPRGEALHDVVEWLNSGVGAVIGTFGFLGGHKGHEEIAETVVKMRADGIPIRFLLLASEHPKSNAAALMKRFEGICSEDPQAMLHLTEFLPIDQCVGLLTLCDAVVYNYKVEVFSQSGAASVGALAGKPLLTSTSPMLGELPVAARWRLGHTGAMRQVFEQFCEGRFDAAGLEALQWGMARRADVLAKNYRAVYEAAIRNLVTTKHPQTAPA